MKKTVIAMSTIIGLIILGVQMSSAQGQPPLRYVVIHKPGPKWQPGVDFRKQPGVRDHVAHYMKLNDAKKLAFGGPFLDNSGGMMIPIEAVSEQEAREFASSDPAVKDGLLSFEVKPWMIAMSQESESSDLTFELKLPISVDSAWNLWTASKKLEQWLTTKANVQSKVDGAYELFWDPANPQDNSTLGCKVTALVPYKLLSFQWRGPVHYADLMNVQPFPTWVLVSFESTSPNETVIHFRHSGWGSGAKWKEAREWQSKAWSGAFQSLEKLVNKK